MKRNGPKRATRAEERYIRDLQRVSAFDLVEQGRAKIVPPAEYPEPLKRFLAREKTMLHVKLTAAVKRQLEARSRQTGTPAEELARRWIERGIAAEQ